MPDDRFSQLKPPAIIATIASLRRRFGEVFISTADSDPDEVAAYEGRDGRSVLDLLASAVETLQSGHDAIAAAVNRDDAVVVSPVAQVIAASTDRQGHLDQLELVTGQLGLTLAALSGDDWGREAQGGGGPVTLQGLAQALVRSTIELLEASTTLASDR